MPNPLHDAWVHGPDADPDPEVAEVIALMTEYQLGLLSDIERAMVDRRLKTDRRFAEIAAPLLWAARAWQMHRYVQETAAEGRDDAVPPIRDERIPRTRRRENRIRKERRVMPSVSRWARVRRQVTVWRIAASVVGVGAMTYSANAAYGAILRSRLAPASVTFTNAPLSVVMRELRRRYHIEVEVCDASVMQDRVTLTLTDAPVEAVADEIAQQTLRVAYWPSPYALHFRPQPAPERGFWYNLRLVYRALTDAGCHP